MKNTIPPGPLTTIRLLGFDIGGTKCAAVETYRIQEFHLPIYHCLSLMAEEDFSRHRKNRLPNFGDDCYDEKINPATVKSNHAIMTILVLATLLVAAHIEFRQKRVATGIPSSSTLFTFVFWQSHAV